jgi:hypothetical protein
MTMTAEEADEGHPYNEMIEQDRKRNAEQARLYLREVCGMEENPWALFAYAIKGIIDCMCSQTDGLTGESFTPRDVISGLVSRTRDIVRAAAGVGHEGRGGLADHLAAVVCDHLMVARLESRKDEEPEFLSEMLACTVGMSEGSIPPGPDQEAKVKQGYAREDAIRNKIAPEIGVYLEEELRRWCAAIITGELSKT